MYTYDEKMAHIVAQFMHFDQALANDEQNKVIYWAKDNRPAKQVRDNTLSK